MFIQNIVILGVFLSTSVTAQIFLDNPSLEGTPQDAVTPLGWLECEKGTTPDILPGPWGVYNEPFDGKSYIGLITRSEGSWEAIGQRLKQPLKKDNCYELVFHLAHSITYAGYNEPVIFRVWGGADRCEKTELIGKTQPIDHEDWRAYRFKIKPKMTLKYLIIEVYYDPEKKYTHNGHVLIDGIQPIIWCARA